MELRACPGSWPVRWGLAVMLITLAAGCGDIAPMPSPTPSPSLEPSPSPTPTYTSTPPAIPTAAPTGTPAPVPTQTQIPTPTGTPTPMPSPTPTPTGTPTPSPTPTPTYTLTQPPTATPTLTPTLSPTAIPTPPPTPSPTAVPAEVIIGASDAIVDYPHSISFRLDAYSFRQIQNVELEFGTDRVYSCATRSYSSVRLELEPAFQVDLSWEWQMKKTGSIPPGAAVWWRWRVEDEDGRHYLSPRQELAWEDSRFEWSSHSLQNLTIYWYEGGDTFGQELTEAVSARLGRLALAGQLGKPIKAFVYATPQDVRDAVLFAQQWTGGLAFTSYNILLIAIPPDPTETQMAGLVHELAHLMIKEVAFNCFRGLPTWLEEGLATYSEGPLAPFLQSSLASAELSGSLISIGSLNSSFPAGPAEARLSYAQSYSVVKYLVEGYGWARMRELLATFREGRTSDEALQEAYGFDSDGLDDLWREYVGVK